MNGLVKKVCARVEELTGHLRFYRPGESGGTLVAPRVIDTFLAPEKRSVEGEECPVIQVALYKGELNIPRGESGVLIYGLLYTEGDVQQGTAEIKELAEAVGGIVRKRSFLPFTLNLPVQFSFGDQDQGREAMQPHPYHFFKMYLNFSTGRGTVPCA